MPDTIYALSSGNTPSGVAIIRISGPEVRFALETICGLVPDPGQTKLCKFSDPSNDEIIDQGLVLYFRGPASYTGEDVGEFHAHGSSAVIRKLFEIFSTFENFRMAEAGEFSLRAFENRKLDLTAVEGISDLIHAETESQRKLAMAQNSGRTYDMVCRWSEQLLKARSFVEADIDFVDEDDVDEGVSSACWPIIDEICRDIDRQLEYAVGAEIGRDGYKIALLGVPNAGKSSLINRLADREIAITSEVAGTTRDVLETKLNISGMPVIMFDTAGLRDSGDPVERVGIAKAKSIAQTCHLTLLLVDAVHPVFPDPLPKFDILVQTKVDCLKQDENMISSNPGKYAENGAIHTSCIGISSLTGTGIDELIDMIGVKLSEESQGWEQSLLNRSRQISVVKNARKYLEYSLTKKDVALEIRSEYLRNAQHALGKLTGTVDVEDVLGEIFSGFCVGK